MKTKNIFGGLIGFVIPMLPILGSLILGILLYVRKKYKLLFIPGLCLLFFILAMVYDVGKIEKLPGAIENKFFSISFPTDEKMTLEQFSNTVQSALRDTLSDDAKNMQEYQKLLDKCYMLYKTEYTKNRSDGDSFYLSVTGKDKIKENLDSFRSSYIHNHRYRINFYNFSLVLFFLLYLFSIPFSVYIFYKYLFIPKTDNFESIVHNNATQKKLYDSPPVDIDKIISVAEPQSPTITAPSIPVKINYASITEIQEELKTTAIQSKMILEERKSNGDFLDFSDFIKRTGLSERVCNQFKNRLDFSVNTQSNKQLGRILDV